MFIRELTTGINTLKGISTETVKKFHRLGIYSLSDLCLYKPRAYEDLRNERLLKDFANGKVYCEIVIISHLWFGRSGKKILKLIIQDTSGTKAELLCFNRDFLAKQFPQGSHAWLYGDFSWKYGILQSSNFKLKTIDTLPPKCIVPIYPLTAGLSNDRIYKTVLKVLEQYSPFDDEIPEAIRTKRNFPDKTQAIKNLHQPVSPEARAQAIERLGYEELFYFELLVLRRSLLIKDVTKERQPLQEILTRELTKRLPFSLTADQLNAIKEIKQDLEKPWPMMRLLQGDVGSGKTLVSFFAMLFAVERGEQAALLCPTELLAKQHAETAAHLLEPLGVRLALFTSSIDIKARKLLLDALSNGEIDIVIGTHALFSDNVFYRKLSLIIIDEQHRFGVLQRLALSSKGEKPDILLMSATPIPRTLALTVYGDLAVSSITTMPPGRKPIKTHLVKTGNELKAYEFVKKQLLIGKQAYFIYPLIEESETVSLKNATQMYSTLSKFFAPLKGGLIHSKMDETSTQNTMEAFRQNRLSFLVSTSIVEVGVDVPNATCMVIEHAERFGLAALHQLRGRIGRGNDESYCFLVWSEPLTEEAKKRLTVMKNTTDGFVIAEEDLAIRGPGDITGTAQSGLLQFNFADPIHNTRLLEWAREDASELLAGDPELTGKAGSLVKTVLAKANPFIESLTARA